MQSDIFSLEPKAISTIVMYHCALIRRRRLDMLRSFVPSLLRQPSPAGSVVVAEVVVLVAPNSKGKQRDN